MPLTPTMFKGQHTRMHVCYRALYYVVKVFYTVVCSWQIVPRLLIDVPKFYGKYGGNAFVTELWPL